MRPNRSRAFVIGLATVAGLIGAPAPVVAVTGYTGPEVILPNRFGQFFDMDAAGKTHVITHPSPHAADQYADKVIYATNASGAWTYTPILAHRFTSYPTVEYLIRDFKVNAAGKAFVLYTRCETPDDIEFTCTMWVRTNRTGAWVSKQVLAWDEYALTVGPNPSLGISGDRIHVAFDCDGPTGNPKSLSAARICLKKEAANGTWMPLVVLGNPQRYSFAAVLAIDAQGHHHLAYKEVDGVLGVQGLRYATDRSGAFSSTLVFDFKRWAVLGDDVNNWYLDTGPNGQAHLGLHMSSPLYNRLRHLYYATNSSGTWSITRIRDWTAIDGIAVGSDNRPHLLTYMCIPVCTGNMDLADTYHGMRTATGWAWSNLTPGWPNDADGYSLTPPYGSQPAIVMPPWNKPCFYLVGGYTSDPVEEPSDWVQYRMCRTL